MSSVTGNDQTDLCDPDGMKQVCHLCLFMSLFIIIYHHVTNCSHHPLQVLNQKARNPADRYSMSLDDVRLFSPLLPLGTASVPDTSVSYTFGLPHTTSSPCPDKTSFCVQRSTNCLSLDLLDDNQLLELVL